MAATAAPATQTRSATSSPSSRSGSSAGLAGWLEPRRRVARRYTSTHGDAAAALSAKWYLPLTRWQLEMIRDWGAVDGTGQFVHRRCGASVVRQAGKSEDAIAWTIYLAVVLHHKVLYTAHNYSTTMEMRRRIRKVFGRRPRDPQAENRAANALVTATNNNTSQEAIELRGGGVIAFSTRTESAALGYSFDTVIIDEAQEYTTTQQRIIMPTTTSGAAHNLQFVFVGTPRRASSKGDIWEPMRDAAWGDEPDDDLCWWEYGVEEPGDPEDEGRWRTVNPSLVEGVANLEAIRTGYRQMRDAGDTLGFVQEYLGYWLPREQTGEQTLIAPAEWAALAGPAPEAWDKFAFGVRFTPDGASVALAQCVTAGAASHVEFARQEPTALGVDWLVATLTTPGVRKRCAAIAIDGKADVEDLCRRLGEAGLPKKMLMPMRPADAVTAAGMLMNAVHGRELSHLDDPALAESALGATRRPIGNGGFGFGGTCPERLDACAAALWAARTTKRDPRRRGRIG